MTEHYTMTLERLQAVAEAAGVTIKFARELCVETDWECDGKNVHQDWLDTESVTADGEIARWLREVWEKETK